MTEPIFQRRDRDFSSQNLFLQMVLGVVSASSRLEELLARHGGDTLEPCPTAGDPTGQAMLHALLGVLSLMRRTLRVLPRAGDTAGVATEAPLDEAVSPSRPASESLLR